MNCEYLRNYPSTSLTLESTVNNYNLSKTESSRNTSHNITGVLLAATITATPITINSPAIVGNSSILSDRNSNSSRKVRGSKSAVSTFTTELNKISRSITPEESKIMKKMIESKAKPGIPRF